MAPDESESLSPSSSTGLLGHGLQANVREGTAVDVEAAGDCTVSVHGGGLLR